MKIKKVRDVPTPAYAHRGDAGLDLTNASGCDVVVPAGRVVKVPTGIAAAIPTGHAGLLMPRSSLGKKRDLSLSNTVGLIDSTYTGEIIASVINRGHRDETIEAGERIVQLVIIPFAAVEVEVVEVLEATERGEGGFGSTGTHEVKTNGKKG